MVPNYSLIIRLITKSDDRAAGVRFAYHELITDRIGRQEVLLPVNHKNYNFRERKNSQVMKERKENLHSKTDKVRSVDLNYNFKCVWLIKTKTLDEIGLLEGPIRNCPNTKKRVF